MHWLLNRWIICISAATALVVFCVVAFLCRHYRIYSRDHWLVYQAMEKECHPAWRDYTFRRINAGDDVEEVIRSTKPMTVIRHGRRVELHYDPPGFTGMSAYAYGGKMVIAVAGSCTWMKVFFDETSDEQCLEFFGKSKTDLNGCWGVPVYR